MNALDLKALVRKSLQQTPAEILLEDLESPRVQALCQRFLGAGPIRFSNYKIEAETNTGITVNGVLAGRFAGQDNPVVTAEFWVANDATEVRISTELPASWKLTEAFSSLKESAFEFLGLGSNSWIVDSTSVAFGEEFPGEFGYPDYLAAEQQKIVHGLSLAGTLQTARHSFLLDWFLGKNTVSYRCEIAFLGDEPIFQLSTGTLPNTPQLAGFDLPSVLRAVCLPLQDSTGTHYESTLQIESAIQRDLGNSGSVEIPFFIRSSGRDSSVSVQSRLPPDRQHEISLGELPKLLDKLEIAGLVPDSVPALDAIYLRSVRLDLAPGLQSVLGAYATVAYQTPPSWSLFGGLISLEEISVTCGVIGPGTANATVGSLGAVARVGDGALRTSVDLPDLDFWCQSEPGSVISLSDLFQKAVGTSVDLGDVTCSYLRLSGNVAEERFRFKAVVSNQWPLALGGGKSLRLDGISLEVAHTSANGGTTSGEILGTFSLANAHWYASAQSDDPASGWTLTGGTVGQQSISLTHLTADAFALFGVTFPDNTPDFELTSLLISLNTQTKDFSFAGALEFDVRAAKLKCFVNLGKVGAKLTFQGSIWIGSARFEADFLTEAQKQRVRLAWESAPGREVGLLDLIQALNLDLPAIPASFDLGLRRADVIYDSGAKRFALAADSQNYGRIICTTFDLPTPGGGGKPASPNVGVFVGIKIGGPFDLRRLPLVGDMLERFGGFGIEAIQLSLASTAIDKNLASTINGFVSVLGNDYPSVPAAGLMGRVGFSMQLRLDDEVIPLTIETMSSEATSGLGGSSPSPAPISSPGNGGLKWYPVQKTFGPVHFEAIGAGLDGRTLTVAMDASLSFAGLTLSLDGLGVSSPLDKFDPSFQLRGLGLDLKRPPLAIGGAFLNADGDFLGKVVISTEKFSLNAIGGFKMLDGAPSMFAYGVLDMPLGGPAFFYVEGLAAGFGLHRRLHLPKIEDVRSFPLVANAGVKTQSKPDPDAEFRKLHDYVFPQAGEYFFAAGIKFNSFRLLHGFALLVVSVGRDLEVDLIGTADFASPPDLPEGLPAMASIQLDLIARIAPAEGLIAVEAQLNPKSYVYGPLCHLSGGFAFYAWTKGDLRGDFVLSVGGYHPEYDKPRHYPAVPRVELKYQASPEVYLKGDAYFALTPSIMMAGGGLHADMRSGSLHAWADLTVDFWVAWEPFHYDARVHIGIGAQWKCFHTSASADLHIWGPEFSGTAHVDWFIFSFDLEFGPQSPVVPLLISLEKFKKSFLGVTGDTPAEIANTANATLGVILAKGVVGDADGTPVVSPAELVVSTSSRVPAKTASLGKIDLGISNPTLGVTPAAGAAIQTSNHVVKVERDGVDVSNEFATQALDTGFPAALWAPRTGANANDLPIRAVSGLELRPKEPPKPGQSTEMRVGDLAYEVTLRATRDVVTEVGASGPMPVALPDADLAKLGLHPAALAFVSNASRPTIGLGGSKGGAIG